MSTMIQGAEPLLVEGYAAELHERPDGKLFIVKPTLSITDTALAIVSHADNPRHDASIGMINLLAAALITQAMLIKSDPPAINNSLVQREVSIAITQIETAALFLHKALGRRP